MKINFVMDAIDRDGGVVEVRTDAASKEDAKWIFGHSSLMMGLRARWFTLRKAGAKKKKKPAGYIDSL